MASNLHRFGARITDVGSRICCDSGAVVCSEREGSNSRYRCRVGLIVYLRLGAGKVPPFSYGTQEPRRPNESNRPPGTICFLSRSPTRWPVHWLLSADGPRGDVSSSHVLLRVFRTPQIGVEARGCGCGQGLTFGQPRIGIDKSPL